MIQLALTGLGNEVDLKTGRTVFTAIFNGKVRIEISKEAAQILTTTIYASPAAQESFTQEEIDKIDEDRNQEEDYRRAPISESPSEGEEFGGDNGVSPVVLEDTAASVYDEDTGVEQV